VVQKVLLCLDSLHTDPIVHLARILTLVSLADHYPSAYLYNQASLILSNAPPLRSGASES
jgi:hypothetical protein